MPNAIQHNSLATFAHNQETGTFASLWQSLRDLAQPRLPELALESRPIPVFSPFDLHHARRDAGTTVTAVLLHGGAIAALVALAAFMTPKTVPYVAQEPPRMIYIPTPAPRILPPHTAPSTLPTTQTHSVPQPRTEALPQPPVPAAHPQIVHAAAPTQPKLAESALPSTNPAISQLPMPALRVTVAQQPTKITLGTQTNAPASGYPQATTVPIPGGRDNAHAGPLTRGPVGISGIPGIGLNPDVPRRDVPKPIDVAKLNPLPSPAHAEPLHPAALRSTLKVLYKPEPIYTAEARALHLEGTVLVRIHIAADNAVQVLGIASGLGHGLDEAAIRSIQNMRVQAPLDTAGNPTPFDGIVKVNFQLAN